MTRGTGWVLLLVAYAGMAWGYKVGPAATLGELSAQSDVIFKGTAISTRLIEDATFESFDGFQVYETRFKIISILKGAAPETEIAFRHYDKTASMIVMYEPQHYHFEVGRTYIVFAKRGQAGGALQQIWRSHTIKKDQGALLCANDLPVESKPVREVVWAELLAMLNSSKPENVLYAIRQLDQMSRALIDETQYDFDRAEVLAVVHPFMEHADPRIAEAAVGVVGSLNAYTSKEWAANWLASVGSADTPYVGRQDPDRKNQGGTLYWKELVAVADSDAPEDTRTKAILALGRVCDPALQACIARWLESDSPNIRAAATVLLSDFPGEDTRARLAKLAGDPAAEVRAAAARAIGFSQEVALADTLARLLQDAEEEVRKFAALSLLSFSPNDTAVGPILRANIANREFSPVFLNAVAREHPEDYLEALAQAIEQNAAPVNFNTGSNAVFMSWEILFKYLRAQPPESVQSGKLDRYLDALEKLEMHSSSEPRDLYAFYLRVGLTDRAKAYRQNVEKKVPYDIGRFFDQAAENPALYTGN